MFLLLCWKFLTFHVPPFLPDFSNCYSLHKHISSQWVLAASFAPVIKWDAWCSIFRVLQTSIYSIWSAVILNSSLIKPFWELCLHYNQSSRSSVYAIFLNLHVFVIFWNLDFMEASNLYLWWYFECFILCCYYCSL